jgi:hypothetical protein
MDKDYQRYHFSATFKTEDLAVLHCLRALCEWAQKGAGLPNIGWGGSGATDWQKNDNTATLRFTDPERRLRWEHKANELLAGKWKLISTSDADPATRQRPKIYR